MSRFSDWVGKTFKGKRIAMLGLKGAGKSQFLKSLGCKDANPGTYSGKEIYNWFKVSYPKKTVFVKSGYDHGGGLEIFKNTFNTALKNSDWVFFIIDIQKYLNNGLDIESNEPYNQQVTERLDYINKNVPNKYLDKIAIILTHADLLDQPGHELINEFQRSTRGKAYSVLTKHCYSMDARDKDQVLYSFKRIIGL